MPDQNDRDAAFRERELDLRAQELELKRNELRRSRWINPLMFALLAATIAAVANIWVASYNGTQQRLIEAEKADRTLRLEADKAQAQRVLAMIQTGDPDKAATNLQFLLDTKLYADPGNELAASLAKRKPGQGPSLPAGVQSAATPPDVLLFDNWNGDAVDEPRTGAAKSPEFKVPRDYYVTYLSNYHWHIAPGQGRGKMHLVRLEDGVFYAPCDAATSPGQNNKADVNWFCRQEARIPAGTYRVIDSDPASWSHNARSENRGFSRVRGYPAN